MLVVLEEFPGVLTSSQLFSDTSSLVLVGVTGCE